MTFAVLVGALCLAIGVVLGIVYREYRYRQAEAEFLRNTATVLGQVSELSGLLTRGKLKEERERLNRAMRAGR